MPRITTVLLLAALAASLCAAPAVAQGMSIVDVNAIIDRAVEQATQQANQAIAQATSAAVSQAISTSGTSATVSTGSAFVGGVSNTTCSVLSKTESSASANGKGCSVSSQVSACRGKLTASATVNGKASTCCVILLDSKYKMRPAYFCATPYKKGVNYELPSSAKIKFVPTCSSKNGNSYGSTECTVQFSTLPYGWVVPTKKVEAALIPRINPCTSTYKFFQAPGDKKSPKTVTSMCQ